MANGEVYTVPSLRYKSDRQAGLNELLLQSSLLALPIAIHHLPPFLPALLKATGSSADHLLVFTTHQ